ncbi:hypothetical protein B0H17DRAFT_1149671 [Mycena rosella]|uniref:Berberine/berberine-like domain-containing protein n=1 Tax=Mycena rosella TaxID=1033263 RepID=A0AAD7C269_MYCRO|nr:hypothetical protein B0H17DRAFT_1149671 [Mycena rosella]
MADDAEGNDMVEGSRLIPASVLRERPDTVGKVYEHLLDAEALEVTSFVIAGGQVAANADILLAVHPAWWTAKTHLLTGNFWTNKTPLAEIDVLRRNFQITQLPIMERLSGKNSAAYSNEADVNGPHFQTTFFGPNYAKLTKIKAKYDPDDFSLSRRVWGANSGTSGAFVPFSLVKNFPRYEKNAILINIILCLRVQEELVPRMNSQQLVN